MKRLLSILLPVLFAAIPATHAKTHVYDPVPTGGTSNGAYNENATLNGQRPNSDAIIKGFKFAVTADGWTGNNHATIRVMVGSTGEGLNYPAASQLTSQGTAFRVNSAVSATEGRLNQRLFDPALLPDYVSGSGTSAVFDNTGKSFHISALLKASDKAAWDTVPANATFIGCGINLRDNNTTGVTASNSTRPTTFPADGVYFGFTSQGLEVSVAGTRAVLVPKAALANGETYLCVARVDVNALGTRERVRAIAFPSDATADELLNPPAQWTVDIPVDVFANNRQFVYLNVGGSTALGVFFDEFRLTRNWQNAVYADTGIEIESASATISGGSLDVSATLAATTPTNALYLCFGSRDFGASTNGWDIVMPWADPVPANVAQTKTVPLSLLPQNTDLLMAVVAFDGTGGDARVLDTVYIPAAGDFIWLGTNSVFASDALNWNQNAVPDEFSNILLDSTSSANMVWNMGVNGLPDKVASWRQKAGYTGTVTFPITYNSTQSAFTNFTITGDTQILDGVWTHTGNTNTAAHRLVVTIGGNLTVGANAKIDANGKGYSTGAGTPSVRSHGGMANVATVAAVTTYGNPKWPVDIGGHDSSQSGANVVRGGGAIMLEVAGAARVDGTVSANGTDSALSGGAGGSVLLTAQALSGHGWVTANGGSGTSGGSQTSAGSGGRIAIYTDAPATFATNSITAFGDLATNGRSSGAGTVFLKTPAEPNGTLVVNNRNTRAIGGQFLSFGVHATTPVNNGETWTFDRVVIGNYGVLGVYQDTGLNLPGGLASVSSLTRDRIGGIRLNGGALDIGAGPQTISGGWIFQAASPFVFEDNLSVTNGGSVGFVRLRQLVADGINNYLACRITVNGDMFVDSTSFIDARHGGWWTSAAPYDRMAHAGTGGRAPTAVPYGSVFNPSLPASGNSVNAGFAPGGGLLTLTVSGELRLDGLASAAGLMASGSDDQNFYSSGGAFNFTLGSLAGTGTINANGGVNDKQGSGSGGRIAIRLTDPAATFDGWPAKIAASGRTHLHNSAVYTYSSAAGTIYLETAKDGDKAGLVIIRNDDNANSPVTLVTPLPAQGPGGDSPLDFKAASLHIEKYGRAALTADLRMNHLSADATAKIQLAGKTLTVKKCVVANVKLDHGVYTADDLPDFLLDSSSPATGKLIIVPPPTLFLLR